MNERPEKEIALTLSITFLYFKSGKFTPSKNYFEVHWMNEDLYLKSFQAKSRVDFLDENKFQKSCFY